MDNQKIEDLLNISLNINNEEREKSDLLESGYNSKDGSWEIIVRYTGNIDDIMAKYYDTTVVKLLNNYAVIKTPQQYVEKIAAESTIEYVEKPKPLYFELQSAISESCISTVSVNSNNPYKLSGKEVITAVIDTGIDVYSSEFINEDGLTRILNIWDQTNNTEMNEDDINTLLDNKEKQTTGVDVIGHGNAVAVIACGNRGVASQSDIIAVKLGVSGIKDFPRTTQLMTALDYVISKARKYGKAVAVNISFGNNYGSHTGDSLLETYINSIANVWKSTICVGAGNEGTGATHAGGNLKSDVEETIEIAVGGYETNMDIQIWKDYQDDFEVEIITPAGRNLGRISRYNKVNSINVENTTVLTYYGEPSPYSRRQEIYINLLSLGLSDITDGGNYVNNIYQNSMYIEPGIWKLRLIPVDIVNGRFDMWLPAISSLNNSTGFVKPDSSYTYTIPSTATGVISVGAYNSRTRTMAAFSGRGYTAQIAGSMISKPDIVAPGVNIQIPSKGGVVSGTSFATPFVTGSAALLMEWGIVKKNDPYLYGEKVKAYLIKGARTFIMQPFSDLQQGIYGEIPNAVMGWGALCVKDALD